MRLPLNAFEEYMFLDDSSSYPMNCYQLMSFVGTIDRERFEQSLRATLAAKHPLAICRVVKTKNDHYYWEKQFDNITIDWYANTTVSESNFHGKAFDPFSEPSFRLYFFTSENKFEIVLELHHSLSDAAGLFSFLNDVFKLYASGDDIDSNTETSDEIIEQLRNRNSFGLNAYESLRRFTDYLCYLPRAWTFLFRYPISIVPYDSKLADSPLPEKFPTYVTKILDIDQTNRLKQSAHANGVSINDISLAAVFRAIEKFRNKQNIPRSRKKFRIAVPTDLRRPTDKLSSISNRVSMVFIDRSSSQINDSEKLLTTIHKEMCHIKKHTLGWAFIFGLGIYKKVFGNFRGMSRQKRCWSSVVVTNLQQLFKNPNNEKLKIQSGKNPDKTATLETIETYPPIRPWTTISIGIYTYANQFYISTSYDSRVITEPQANQFCDICVEELNAIIQKNV